MRNHKIYTGRFQGELQVFGPPRTQERHPFRGGMVLQ